MILNLNNTDIIGFDSQNKLDWIFSLLGSIWIPDQIYVCVSGGSDSMLLINLVLIYYKKNDLDTKKIHILHYNHHQRTTSNEDEKFVHQRSINNNITYIWASYFWRTKQTENNLRKSRRDFFRSSMGWSKNPIILTWHHLDDRIETTIINLKRWCHLRWFYNMSTYKKCLNRDDFNNILYYVHLRPLLHLSKGVILDICKKNNIVFVQDQTNNNPSVSQRNKVRAYLSQIDFDYGIFEKLYQTQNTTSNVMYKKLNNFNTQIEEYYHIVWIKNINDVCELLDFVWAYTNITQWYLEELLRFVKTWNWTKKIKDRHLVKAHGQIYLILASDQFRSKLQVSKIQWKKYNSKSLSRRYINQKIPFFLRQELCFELKNWSTLQPHYRKDVVRKWWLAC